MKVSLKRLVGVCLPLAFVTSAAAQEILKIDQRFACAAEAPQPVKEATLFPSTEAATRVLRDIVARVGLSADNIDLRASDVQNAVAYLDPISGRRLILYNEDFVRRLQADSGSAWVPLAILAHELAHHLNNHLQLTAADRRRVEELEADRFAGHVLFKMGADVKAVTAVFAELREGEGYPSRSARIAAATNGWWIAKEQGGYTPKTAPVDTSKNSTSTPENNKDPHVTSSAARSDTPLKAEGFALRVEQLAFVPHTGGLAGGPGLKFSAQGSLHAPQGSTFQIIVTFAFADGRVLYPAAQEPHYRGLGNLLTTGSIPTTTPADTVDLSSVMINPIPYYCLSLIPTGYHLSYPLVATAQLMINGVVVATATPVTFNVQW